MKRISLFLFVLPVLVLLGGCNSTNVISTVDTNVLKNYKTFAFVAQPEVKAEFNRDSRKKVIELDIQREVSKELESKGFVYNASNPDFLVNPKAILEKDADNSSLDWTKPGNSRGDAAKWGSSGGNMSNASTVPVQENMLKVVIELSEPSGRTFWIGSKNRIIGEMMTLSGILKQDVKTIFKKLPSDK